MDDTQLTRAARIQLAGSLRRRYQATAGRAKKQILNEFVAVSGYHPKYAIYLLNAAEPGAPVRRTRVRTVLYDAAAKQALIVLWESSDRVCGPAPDLRYGRTHRGPRVQAGCSP
jgi:hypothetical protein